MARQKQNNIIKKMKERLKKQAQNRYMIFFEEEKYKKENTE